MNNEYYPKYIKYKSKYIDTMARVESQNILLPINAIDKLYSDKYRIYTLYKMDKRYFESIISYIYSNFKNLKAGDFSKLLSKKFSDADFYKFLRLHYKNNILEIIHDEHHLYETKHIIKKINNINTTIKKYLPNLEHSDNCNILDIGTENIHFLYGIEKIMKCKAYGLNIQSGFSHYSGYNDAVKSGKILLYDGINFPFNENSFSLVILIAVIHHITYLEKFIDNLCKITKNIYIKDNDMIDQVSEYNVEIQHEVYEGLLYPNDRSPLYRTTNLQIVKLLEKNNFRIIYNTINSYFTRPYVLVASKNNIAD